MAERLDQNIDIIVKRCQSGDNRAFKDLYDLHSTKAYNIAVRVLSDSDSAKDAVQETFIKVYKNICSFKFESAFFTWFYKILMNSCLDALRKKKDSDEIDDLNGIENEYSNDIKEILEKEISLLPSQYRTVFVLFEIEGFSHQEISSVLGIAIGTSKSNLHRAKEILKEKIKKYHHELVDE